MADFYNADRFVIEKEYFDLRAQIDRDIQFVSRGLQYKEDNREWLDCFFQRDLHDKCRYPTCSKLACFSIVNRRDGYALVVLCSEHYFNFCHMLRKMVAQVRVIHPKLTSRVDPLKL